MDPAAAAAAPGDHYDGLTDAFSGPGLIHCTSITARLVVHCLGVNPELIKSYEVLAPSSAAAGRDNPTSTWPLSCPLNLNRKPFRSDRLLKCAGPRLRFCRPTTARALLYCCFSLHQVSILGPSREALCAHMLTRRMQLNRTCEVGKGVRLMWSPVSLLSCATLAGSIQLHTGDMRACKAMHDYAALAAVRGKIEKVCGPDGLQFFITLDPISSILSPCS